MRKRTEYLLTTIALLLVSTSSLCHAATGKLIGTAGLSQIEGSGGGGLVPWATLTGYDSQEQISVNAQYSQANLDNYKLDVLGVSASFYDKIEISIAQHEFELKDAGVDIKQHIVGIKYKLYGDAVYSKWPQFSLGVQFKDIDNGEIARAVGAIDSDKGTDIYLAATKVHLGAIAGYNAVWNLTARATKANELGLLGFGGIENGSYQLMLEASAGVLLSRHLVIGAEYRQKPDNLGLGEDDWKDLFISYIPSKDISFTLAWADLGAIAGVKGQQGLYFSLSGQLR